LCAPTFSLDCPPLCASTFSLDCPPLCAPTVFSGLSFLVCPYSFLWIVRPCVPLRFFLVCPFLRTTQRKPQGHTRVENPEKTVGAHKGGQSRENRRGTQERTTQKNPLWIVHLCVPLQFSLEFRPLCAPTDFSGLSFLVSPYGFLWIVHPCVPLQFSLDFPPLCAPAVFSELSFLKIRRGTQGRTIQRKP
jgi:hypothetical protein